MERGWTADQVLSALWRRKGLVAIVSGVVFALGASAVMVMPDVYKASVVVRVEPQRPAPDLVQRTVSELLEDRLLTVREEIFARPVLEKVIQEFDLYPKTVAKAGMAAAVEQMRKDLDVKVEGDNAFELTYEARDPEIAAKVANRLPEIFAEQTEAVRRDQAKRATQVFEDEVNEMKGSITAWEKKIADFKVQHMGELPEQLEANMRSIDRLAVQLNTKSEELRVAEARRSELSRMGYAGDTEAGRLKAAEDDLEQKLVEARTEWTADHPEVLRLTREYQLMKKQRQDAEARQWIQRQERAHAAALVTQVQADIADIHKQMDVYQKRLDQTPQWAEELGVLERDYEIAKTKYASVLGRKVEAEIAQDLEAKGAKSSFNVLSAAAVPTGPSKPDRMGGLAIALLIALGLGVLTGVVQEMRDESIRDPNELKQRLPLPVLAVVPQMNGKASRRVLAPQNRTTGSQAVN